MNTALPQTPVDRHKGPNDYLLSASSKLESREITEIPMKNQVGKVLKKEFSQEEPKNS